MHSGSGCIVLIIGPMTAGKTTEMLRRVRARRRAGGHVLVVRARDPRADAFSAAHLDGAPSVVVTHTRHYEAAVCIERVADIEATGYDMVAIDEAQFLDDPDDLVHGCEALARAGKTVVVAGLVGSYRREPFGHLYKLFPCADELSFIYADCACGERAPFTMRTPAGVAAAHGALVHVVDDLAGDESAGSSPPAHYRAVCRACFECTD